MADIDFSSSKVKIKTGAWTFEEIYQEMISQGKSGYIERCGNHYTFANDLYIGNSDNSYVVVDDTNVSITVLGDKLQIRKNSTLSLGVLRANGSTYGGCTLYMPSPRFSKGFGHTSTNRSGNFIAYGSKIDVECYWGFYEGSNEVQLIDCIVNGFGRISGDGVILRNLSFDKSNGKYGLFHGNIQEASGWYSRHTETYGGKDYAIYVDTDYTDGDMVIRDSHFSGYAEGLLYKDRSSHHSIETITFLDCEIMDGYDVKSRDDNSNMNISYTFNPTVFDSASEPLTGQTVICYDVDGNPVFHTVTDSNGQISQEVVMYEYIGNDATGSIKTPHTLEIDVDGHIESRRVMINRPIKGMGIYLVPAGGTIDLTPVLDAIKSLEAQNTDITDALVNGNFVSGKVNDVAVQAVDGAVTVLIDNPTQTEFNVVLTVKDSLEAVARVENETLNSFDIILYDGGYLIEDEHRLDTSNSSVTINYILTFA
jgi:hypothetical protein